MYCLPITTISPDALLRTQLILLSDKFAVRLWLLAAATAWHCRTEYISEAISSYSTRERRGVWDWGECGDGRGCCSPLERRTFSARQLQARKDSPASDWASLQGSYEVCWRSRMRSRMRIDSLLRRGKMVKSGTHRLLFLGLWLTRPPTSTTSTRSNRFTLKCKRGIEI
jgi:hypothetical protein